MCDVVTPRNGASRGTTSQSPRHFSTGLGNRRRAAIAATGTQWSVLSAFGEVVPVAVAIAASPFPVIPAILLLFTPRPLKTGGMFLLGWFTGVLAVTLLFVGLAAAIQSRDYPPAWASWTRLLLGAALLILGIKQWFSRGASKEAPAWIGNIATADGPAALRLGLLLSGANPKVVLFAAAGGLQIGAAELSLAGTTATALAFTVVASVSVAAPILAYAVLGERVLGPLGKARDWLERNNTAIMAIVMAVIGALLISKGVSGL